MTTSLVKGSIGQIAKETGKPLAQTFLSADVIVLVDTSGSMRAQDSRGGRTRYDIACEELAALQGKLPGKIGVISFSGSAMFCPDGVPYDFGGTTNLAGALDFARVADVADMRFIVISDGEPDDDRAALKTAAKYKGRIDVIYVGPEDKPDGREFLQRLARARGGEAVTADRAQQLAAATERLLLTA